MLETPEEEAQNIIAERMPTPRFVKADYGSGQERLIKSALDPNLSGTGEMKEGYFVSDDVSLKVFMEHLIKKAEISYILWSFSPLTTLSALCPPI